MAILAVKTDRMDITMDLSSGYIFVQQKWRYNWIDESGRKPWTLQEKRDFHNRADKWIWKLWSSKAYAMITGNSNLARKYKNTKFRINVDIKWVVGSENEHWNVEVRKISINVSPPSRSEVFWNSRRIKLYSCDVDEYAYAGKANPSIKYVQYTVAHEFGHAFGNTNSLPDSFSSIRHGDEYREPYLSIYQDDGSMMSVGSTVRQRHYDYLKSELERMMNIEFEIHLF
jgi:hypothetical protein